ncbi:MAG: ATP-binding protein [Gammaproteobacteria bacterium]|nr:ATP-binding protein [Gammaproteobacteria bacterium]
MIPRLLTLPDDESFFLFGPRGVGKTTLLKHLPWFSQTLYINLLKPGDEMRFIRNPGDLESMVRALPPEKRHIIIDEIQKVPRLLDVVHDLIETSDKKFILTGSSARKLKHGGANLLAGRAFVYHLNPFNYFELTQPVELIECLRFGMLPKIFEYDSDEKKQLYLEAYTNTYLKEEIWAEQFIRELDPFRRFLEVAAQTNGKIVNFSNLARDVGTSDKNIQKYFSILEDTLLGFFLEAFQHSFRKRLSKTPKFYFFDTGIVRALSAQLSLPLLPSTSQFGDVFEHFIILQAMQLANYFHRDYRFSYLKTKDDAEIDLVVERPGLPLLFIEIKSSENVQSEHLTTLKRLANDFGTCEVICISRDIYAKQLEGVRVYPWAEGLNHYFGKKR